MTPPCTFSLPRHLALVLALLLAAPATAIAAAPDAAVRPDSPTPRLVAFRGHFGGLHLGGSRFGRRRGGLGGLGRRGSSRGLLHRIARALAFAYILHLLFSHGGISILIWLVVIALLIYLFRRRRRRGHRFAY